MVSVSNAIFDPFEVSATLVSRVLPIEYKTSNSNNCLAFQVIHYCSLSLHGTWAVGGMRGNIYFSY